MFKQVSLALAAAAALFVSVPASASDVVYPGGGTLAQVVDGGGTYSIITLMNLDTVPAPYTLYFLSDSGGYWTLNTSAGVATGGILTGVLPVGGSTIIRTNDVGSTVNEGYAVVVSESPNCYGFGSGGYCQLAGSTVFGITLNGTVLEASCPLDTGTDYMIAFPFDSTTSVTGVALANSPGDKDYQIDGAQTANLAISFYNQNGTNFYSTTMQLAFGQHTAFLLTNQFPQSIGQTGMVVISATDSSGNPYIIKTLGLRVNNAGTTYTSVTPVIPCNFYYSAETGGYCTN